MYPTPFYYFWDIVVLIPYFVAFLSLRSKLSLKEISLFTFGGIVIIVLIPKFFVSSVLNTMMTYLLLVLLFLYTEKRLSAAMIHTSFVFLSIFLASETAQLSVFSALLEETFHYQFLLELVFIVLYCLVLKKIGAWFIKFRYGEIGLIAVGNAYLFWELVTYNFIELDYAHSEGFLIHIITGIFFCFFLLFTVVALLAQHAIDMSTKNERERALYNNSRNYMTNLEQQALEIRKFKHDYQNILLSMDRFFHEQAYDELEQYYREHIRPASDRVGRLNLQLAELKKVQSLPLKSLLYAKLSALDAKISLSLEIERPINFTEKQLIPLIRITGILLDNAIEALQNLPDGGTLRIGFLYDDHWRLIVENDCAEGLPPVYQLEAAGYSTKGKNRGLGLQNARELSRENGFLLTTTIKNSTFTQILEIGGLT